MERGGKYIVSQLLSCLSLPDQGDSSTTYLQKQSLMKIKNIYNFCLQKRKFYYMYQPLIHHAKINIRESTAILEGGLN